MLSLALEYQFILGVLITMIWIECSGFSPGGIITPAYLAVYNKSPEILGYLLVLSVGLYWIMKACSQTMILYGRRKLFVSISILFVIYVFSRECFQFKAPILASSLFPALLARDMEKQGLFYTLIAFFSLFMLVQLWR